MQGDKYDRTSQDVGNLVAMEHVNLRVPDQGLATTFYVVGLGFTRDPYMMVGTENMWINVGQQQFHLPTGRPQRTPGYVDVVVPDLDALALRLAQVRDKLAGTAFAYSREAGTVLVTCPWGNRLRCHGPGPEFGDMTLGIARVEFPVAQGHAEGIARFYSGLLGAPTAVQPAGSEETSGVAAVLDAGRPAGAEAAPAGATARPRWVAGAGSSARDGEPSRAADGRGQKADGAGSVARVRIGGQQALVFRETTAAVPPYDGHHIAVYIADFSGPHGRLRERGLVTEESGEHQYRFQDIVDPATSHRLFVIEHEVRSLRHPMYQRPLVNRNPAQRQATYVRGRDAFVPGPGPT
jgi:hypothetical protein